MKAAISLSLSVSMLLGCGSNAAIYGHWEGNRDWKAMGTEDERVARAMAAVNLDLKKDGTFVIQDGGIPFEGNFVLSGSEIRLNVQTILRRPLETQTPQVQNSAAYSAKFESGQVWIKNSSETAWLPMKLIPKPAG